MHRLEAQLQLHAIANNPITKQQRNAALLQQQHWPQRLPNAGRPLPVRQCGSTALGGLPARHYRLAKQRLAGAWQRQFRRRRALLPEAQGLAGRLPGRPAGHLRRPQCRACLLIPRRPVPQHGGCPGILAGSLTARPTAGQARAGDRADALWQPMQPAASQQATWLLLSRWLITSVVICSRPLGRRRGGAVGGAVVGDQHRLGAKHASVTQRGN